MSKLKGTQVSLRPAQPFDAALVMTWENNPEFWAISEESGPYTRAEIENSLAQSYDLRHCGQVRWIVCLNEGRPIGLVDLFNFEPRQQTAGIGIMIGDPHDRGQGYGREAVELLMAHYRQKKIVRAFHCLIHDDNTPSIRLFEKLGFTARKQTIFKGKAASTYTLTDI